MKLKKGVLPALLLTAVAMFLADFFMKQFALAQGESSILVFELPFGIDFYIDCVTNRGAAWGMLSSFYTYLLIFRVGVVVSLLGYIFFACRSLYVASALLSIAVGAFGNVFDCFYYGHVVDMFHFIFGGRSYGIFNLADVWIFLGTIELLVYLSRSKKEKVRDGASKAD